MFNKELLLKFIYEEISECKESITYLSQKRVGDTPIDRFVALEKAKDNKGLLERLKFKIEGCEFDQ